MKELQSCWDGADHLRHSVEVLEVAFTALLVRLQELSGDEVTRLRAAVQGMAAKLIASKRNVGL